MLIQIVKYLHDGSIKQYLRGKLKIHISYDSEIIFFHTELTRHIDINPDD